MKPQEPGDRGSESPPRASGGNGARPVPCSPATQTHVGPLGSRPTPEYVPVIFSQEVSGTLLGQPWATNRASRSRGLRDQQTQNGAGWMHSRTWKGQGERPSAGPGPRDTPGASRALQLTTDPAVLTQLWESHFASRGPSRPRSPRPQGLTGYTAGASPSRRPAALSVGGLRSRRASRGLPSPPAPSAGHRDWEKNGDPRDVQQSTPPLPWGRRAPKVSPLTEGPSAFPAHACRAQAWVKHSSP